MAIIHFAHANGFSAATYRYFFQQLQPHEITYVSKLGHGKYPPDLGWKAMAEEVKESVQQQHAKPVVGIGHSLGGVLTLHAAYQQPNLFSQLILLDPVLLGFTKKVFQALFRYTNFADRQSPAHKAKNRRTQFDSKEEAYDYFKPKTLFRNFHEQCFQDYIDYGLIENGEGITLDFSAKVEYEIFRTIPTFVTKPKLDIPIHFIFSNKFKVLEKSDVRWNKRCFPNQQFQLFDGGHMFPLEKPQETAELIKELIIDN